MSQWVSVGQRVVDYINHIILFIGYLYGVSHDDLCCRYLCYRFHQHSSVYILLVVLGVFAYYVYNCGH